jgi:glycolate oxidase FAD binding subunit
LPSVSSLEEAAVALRAATADGRPVRIGTDIDAGGMGRVLEHEAGDLTCTVEAGIRLSALEAALAPAGQRLSLDPPGDPTIGACLGASLSGPLRHRFGAPRDLVLGVTLVLADGTIANAGGKVVKNVAGYDLGKLVCGSRGRLAFIGRVSLRLHPVPAATATVVVESDDVTGVAAALLASQLVPSAVDVLHPGRVAVLFEGGGAAVAAQVAAMHALVGGEANDGSVWDESRSRQAAATGRTTFDPGSLRELLAGVSEAVIRPSAGVAFLPIPVADTTSAAVRSLQERVRARFDPAGILAEAAA